MNKFTTPESKKTRLLFIWMTLILVCSPALAVDGAREINQACVAAGCFPGDAGGFPVTLKKGGLYIFTSDLDVTDETDPENVTAIVVDAIPLGVVIDLNGFSIRGPVFCLGTPPTQCTLTGTGIGIDSSNNAVTVKNGRIFGMGDDGIQLISAARIEDMQIEDCAGDGIQTTGSGGMYLNNVIRRNGGNGITAGVHSLARGNLIHANIGFGLLANNTTGYGDNVLTQNTGGDVSSGVNMGGNVCTFALCP